MQISYGPEKRRITIERRNLDFEAATELFDGQHFTRTDLREEYGEDRFTSVGMIEADVVVVVWTDREDSRRIISMRKANRDERRYYQQFRDGPG